MSGKYGSPDPGAPGGKVTAASASPAGVSSPATRATAVTAWEVLRIYLILKWRSELAMTTKTPTDVPRSQARRAVLSGRRLRGALQPGLEERLEIPAGDPLRQCNEIRGGGAGVAVLGRPVAQDREERGITDGGPQRLQGHRTPLVDREAVEHPVAARV